MANEECTDSSHLHLGSEEKRFCFGRAKAREPYERLAEEVRKAQNGDSHVRMRAYYALCTSFLDFKPEKREAIATACRAAIATGEWTPVKNLVWGS